jgi:hypothetical protein
MINPLSPLSDPLSDALSDALKDATQKGNSWQYIRGIE